MKHWLALAGIMIISVASVVVSERRKADAPASAAALLYLIADTEQELTRMPVNFTRISEEEEVRVGNEIAKNYSLARGDKPSAEAVEIQAYITQVGTRLATHAHRKLPYRFHYLPARYVVNAFALPGGHVYIGAGLLELMDSEDELAAVLGHEIEHIDHYHCAERVQQEQALRKIPLAELFVLPIEIFEAGYSKNQELEADREGTRLAVDTGYAANAAIRMFQTFQRLYDEYHARTAKSPQEELSQVAIDALEGYFRSHPLPAERIAQINTMIASNGWPPRSERDLAVAYIFWTVQAQDALSAGKYPRAQGLAKRSLQMHPDSATALTVLARAQFAQADFAGAAASYRKILDSRPGSEDAAGYALSLAAANRAQAAQEFRQWLASEKGDTRQLQATLDGLLLLAGDAAPARKLQAKVRQNLNDLSVPGQLSDLGWWSYMAGDYPAAADLLHEAAQRLPDNRPTLVRLAWTEIELRRLADAFRTVNSAHELGTPLPENTMAQAVAGWQAQERDNALRNFEVAVTNQPEWKNQRWVAALYSPLVAQSIQEMQTELERRRKASHRSDVAR